MKRYCQYLELVNDEELIRKYIEVHAHVWPEVMAGQREVGILDMQIYRTGNKVFMICVYFLLFFPRFFIANLGFITFN